MQYFQQPTTMFEGFGMNQAYATPAYMANFRPAYGGNESAENAYAREFSYTDALKEQLLLKGTDSTFATDPAQYMAARHKAIWDAHSDALVQGITYIGTPLAAWYASNKIFGRTMKMSGGNYFTNPVTAAYNAFKAGGASAMAGASRASMASAMAGATVEQSLGASIGVGMGRMVGGAAGGVLNAGARVLGFGGMPGAGLLGAAGGAMGGLIGSMAIPLAVGTLASKAANEFISDPYIAVRRGTDAWLANTANTFVGGRAGPVNGGFGLSHRHAANLSRSLVNSATNDMAFDRQDYNIMADYGMQEGLFNDIGNLNVEDVTRRVGKMADTVKVIMAVANTPSVQEAVKYLGRIKAAGVNDPMDAAAIIRRIGTASAQSGSSVEQIMNTVGNQGQYLYQQAGLLPVIGQTTAASLYGGFANAHKRGLLSNQTMTALGGLEGMTQWSMEANVTALNNPLWRMAFNSGQGKSVGKADIIQMLSNAGSTFAKSPWEYMGKHALNGDIERSEIAAQGPNKVMLSTLESMRKSGLFPGMRMNEGKMNIVDAAGALKSIGFSDEQIRSFYEYVKLSQDPKTLARTKELTRSQMEKSEQQRSSQNGQFETRGIWGVGAANVWVQNANKMLDRGGNAIGGNLANFSAQMSDLVQMGNTYMQGSIPTAHRSLSSLETIRDKDGNVTGQNLVDRDFSFMIDQKVSGGGYTGKYKTKKGKVIDASTFSRNEDRLDSFKNSLKGILANYEPDSEEYRTAEDLIAEMKKPVGNRQVGKYIDKLQKLTNNDFIAPNAGESYRQAASRTIGLINGARFSEKKTSANIKALAKNTSEAIWKNSYANEESHNSWLESGFNFGGPAKRHGKDGMTDDDKLFMQQSGESLAFAKVLDASAKGIVVDNDYTAMVGQIMEDDAYTDLLSKDPKSLTDSEKDKLDIRRAVMLKSRTSIADRKRFDELTKKGLGNLNDNEREEFFKLEKSISDGFGHSMTRDFENNIYTKKDFRTASIMAGYTVNGETAFDGQTETSIENTYQSSDDRNAAIGAALRGEKEHQRAYGDALNDKKNIAGKFQIPTDGSVKDFKEVTDAMKDIGKMNEEIASGLAGEISKLSNSIGTSGVKSSLNANLDALNNNITELNKKLSTANLGPTLGARLPGSNGVTPK